MKIEVLGPGCRNCTTLADRVKQALEATGVEAEVVKVEDFAEIAKKGVLSTPGLVIDGKVVVKGRVPSVEEIKKFIAS